MLRNYSLSHLYAVLVVWILAGCGGEVPDRSYVNFSHLEHLTERIEFLGDSVDIVHIYANYPDYEWVPAAESGPEGITCVDDVARAAVVYLRHYELTGNEESLHRARPLLRFIIKMQLDDGRFYNFIFRDHAINTDGTTSYPSFGWWAVRGVWAAAYAYRIFRETDPPLAAECRQVVEGAFGQIDSVLESYGRYAQVGTARVPAWLIYQFDTYGAALTSELMLGLIEYYKAVPDERVAGYLRKFGEAFIGMQAGDIRAFPYGVFPSTPDLWHAWANGQTQALASAGGLIGEESFIAAGEREVKGLIARIAITGMIREFHIDDPASVREYSQIAYNLRPMIVGALRLFDATGNVEYQRLAGILTGWFFGDNVLKVSMYDPSTGRCFDGINDPETVNMNSGAESTIEALYAILEAEQYPEAKKFFFAERIGYEETGERLAGYFRTRDGDRYVLLVDFADMSLRLMEADSISVR